MRSSSSRIWGYEWQSASSRVRFQRGVLAVDGRARAYGADATARGTIAPTARPVRYQLAGHLTDADMRLMPRQLPLPRLESDLAGELRGHRRGHAARARRWCSTPRRSKRTGIGRGSRGRFSNLDETIRYGFDGRLDHANVEHWGQALDIESLKRDVYASDLSGQLTVDGSGTTLAALVLDAKASLESSTAFDASFERADVVARIENQTLTTSARGNASNVNADGAGRHDHAGLGHHRQLRRDGHGGAAGSAVHAGRAGGLAAASTSSSRSSARWTSPRGGSVARLANGQADMTSFEAQGPQMDVTASGAAGAGRRQRSRT